jgi:hypothetical protein
MSWQDAAGIVGVLAILAAFAGSSLGRLDPKSLGTLSANFIGASLILVSLSRDFNLPSVLMETAWAIVALIGLGRLAAQRLR